MTSINTLIPAIHHTSSTRAVLRLVHGLISSLVMSMMILGGLVVYPALRIFWNTNWKIEFVNVFKFFTHCWQYGTQHTCSFIISHSSCAEQYGNMSSDTQTHTHTHSHTIKPPTAGVQLVGHTSINLTNATTQCISLNNTSDSSNQHVHSLSTSYHFN